MTDRAHDASEYVNNKLSHFVLSGCCLYIHFSSFERFFHSSGSCKITITVEIVYREDRRNFPDPIFLDGDDNKEQRKNIHDFFKTDFFSGIETVTLQNKSADGQTASIRVLYSPPMVNASMLLLLDDEQRVWMAYLFLGWNESSDGFISGGMHKEVDTCLWHAMAWFHAFLTWWLLLLFMLYEIIQHLPPCSAISFYDVKCNKIVWRALKKHELISSVKTGDHIERRWLRKALIPKLLPAVHCPNYNWALNRKQIAFQWSDGDFCVSSNILIQNIIACFTVRDFGRYARWLCSLLAIVDIYD